MGAGYTRQSAADIIDNAIIEAIDHNAEYNALESAFSGSTGHSHDGTLGEGPKISLTTSVTGILPIANGGTGSSTQQGAIDSLFAGGVHVDDNEFFIADPADNTKAVRFDVGNFSTATIRTVTLPDTDLTISPFAASFLDDADAAAVRTTLGVPEIDDDLTAIAALSGTGFPARTAADTWALRSIGGTSNQIVVTNGAGVAGNVTIALPASPTVSGTMTAGAFSTSGTATAGTFSGSGSGLTNLNASNLSTGTVSSARMPTASQSTWSAGASTTEVAISPAKLAATVAVLGTPPGVISVYAGTTAPAGFLLCHGQAVSRTTYATLYSIIGTTYGAGNGSTTFNVPDLRGRVVAGQDDMGGTSANRLTGQSGGVNGDILGGTGGAETHSLTSSQNGAHSHSVSGTTGSGGSHSHSVSGSTNTTGSHTHVYARYDPGNSAGGSGGARCQTPSTNNYNTSSAGNHSHTVSGSTNTVGNHSHSFSATSTTSGSGSAHNNVQPTIILNYIIKY